MDEKAEDKDEEGMENTEENDDEAGEEERKIKSGN